jgi:predicted nucleic acid-binding protein
MQADFPILLDTCVLANAGVCDLFLRLAEKPRMYLPRWSATILDEVKRTQTTKLKRPFPAELADYWRQEVTAAFPEAMIKGFEHLLPTLTNQEKDRHVLAAAIQGNVSVIVTFNLRDFPAAALQPWKVEAVHPQDYLLILYSMNPGVVLAKIADIATDHGEEMQDRLIHLGKSVPAFSRRLLQDSGNTPT